MTRFCNNGDIVRQGTFSTWAPARCRGASAGSCQHACMQPGRPAWSADCRCQADSMVCAQHMHENHGMSTGDWRQRGMQHEHPGRCADCGIDHCSRALRSWAGAQTAATTTATVVDSMGCAQICEHTLDEASPLSARCASDMEEQNHMLCFPSVSALSLSLSLSLSTARTTKMARSRPTRRPSRPLDFRHLHLVPPTLVFVVHAIACERKFVY